MIEPSDYHLKIASYLPPQNIERLGQCSRHWNQICRDDKLWVRLHNELDLPETNCPYVDQIKEFCKQFFLILLSAGLVPSEEKKLLATYLESKNITDIKILIIFNKALQMNVDVALHLYRTGFCNQYIGYYPNTLCQMAFKSGVEEVAVAVLRNPDSYISYDASARRRGKDSDMHSLAIKHKQPESLRLLLIRLPLPQSLRNVLALECAALACHHDVKMALLKVILDIGISQETVQQILYSLRIDGETDLSFVDLLLTNKKMPDGVYVDVLNHALQENHPNLFNMILSHYSQIHEMHLDVLVRNAMKLQQLGAVLPLLERGTLSEVCRAEMVLSATRLNNLQLVAALLTNGPIDHETFYDCINIEEYEDIQISDELTNLLENHSNIYEEKKEALQKAIFEPVQKKAKKED